MAGREGPVKEYAHAGKEGAAVRMGRVAGRQTCARARWRAPEVSEIMRLPLVR